MNDTLRVIRTTLFLAAAGLYSLNVDLGASGARRPSCEEVCDPDASCDTDCEYWVGESLAFSTCGDYDGGPDNGQCNGDSCDTLCGPFAPPERECWSDDQPTDCDTFGYYVACDDGYCAAGTTDEDCGNCPEDCE